MPVSTRPGCLNLGTSPSCANAHRCQTLDVGTHRASVPVICLPSPVRWYAGTVGTVGTVGAPDRSRGRRRSPGARAARRASTPRASPGSAWASSRRPSGAVLASSDDGPTRGCPARARVRRVRRWLEERERRAPRGGDPLTRGPVAPATGAATTAPATSSGEASRNTRPSRSGPTAGPPHVHPVRPEAA